MKALILAALALFVAMPAAAAADWRALDPENALVIDTTKGRIVVELVPLAAPASVARIKELTRAGFYDGLTFHRVVEDFMAQTGDPQGTGQGGSDKPNVPAEFTFKRGADGPFQLVAEPSTGDVGFIGSMPVMSQKSDLMLMMADGKVAAWGMFCPGVIGMARTDLPDTANSQFFLMSRVNATLERKYTAFGRVVVGLDVVRKLKVGEPPVDPDKMVKVQMLADMPAGQRPSIQLLDPSGAAFKALMKKADVAAAFDHAACNVELPVQMK